MIVAAGAMLAMGGTAMAGPAAWCKGAGDQQADMRELSSNDSRTIISAFVAVECKPTSEVEAHRAEIEKSRAAWGKRLGMTDEDFGDAAEWAATSQVERKNNMIHFDLDKKPWSSFGP